MSRILIGACVRFAALAAVALSLPEAMECGAQQAEVSAGERTQSHAMEQAGLLKDIGENPAAFGALFKPREFGQFAAERSEWENGVPKSLTEVGEPSGGDERIAQLQSALERY